MNDAQRRENRLAGESSPYLLQHARNPVDWYPWNDEALSLARAEDKPIFLSIGYSACHWCHVMEHESFENPEIAALLNENFVCVKVDREERPDLDQIYMAAVQLMTGRGGWPMSVFLTPSLQPFYGGTYWPPHSKMGMPGFDQVLNAVLDAWRTRRDQADSQAQTITNHIQQIAHVQTTESNLDAASLLAATGRLEQAFDFTHGGFGDAPKFPHSTQLEFLLRMARRTGREEPLQMVRLNLDKMAAGGIYDHLAGGFARYSVDARWLVPHFEKMLYDNALLANVYLDAFGATGDPTYARIVRETLNYVLRSLTDDAGGFHSTEDADSEGVEGKFYVWTPEETRQVLGAELSERFNYVYDVSDVGNFEHSGSSILNLPKSLVQCAAIKGWDQVELQSQMDHARKLLLAARDQRVRPSKDDKVLANWNGLMIRAMARAGAALDEDAFLEAASRAAKFVRAEMRDSQSRLLHSWRNGQARIGAYLDDYACLASGFVALYEATFHESWIDRAAEMVDVVFKRFSDPAEPGFFYTADDQEGLIVRLKDMHDNATPCGNSVMATVLARLGRICSAQEYTDRAWQLVQAASGVIERSPLAAGQWLLALDELLGPSSEIVLVGTQRDDATRDVLRRLRSVKLPAPALPPTVVMLRDEAVTDRSPRLDAMFRERPAQAGELTAYVCSGATCQPPRVGKDAILQFLEG